MEAVILELSQRLQEQLVELPSSALESTSGRLLLAEVHSNALNPFGFTHQRNKAARKATAAQTLAAAPDAENVTPLQHAPDSHSARPSPTPFEIFRGRLSFGIDGSARKFECVQTPRVPTIAVKRKLTNSPSGNLMLVFPSVKRSTTCKRRCPWFGDDDINTAALGRPVEKGVSDAKEQYWSDPLPLPRGLSLVEVDNEEAAMQDTAASSPPPCHMAPAQDDCMLATSPLLQPASQEGEDGVCFQLRSGSPFGSSCMDTDSPLVNGSGGFGAVAAQPMPFSPLPSGLCSCVPLVEHPDCGLPCITPQTAVELVDSQGAAYGFERCVVIDCRYGYEYAGGCISGAVSINMPDDMDRFLSDTPLNWSTTAVVYHCEFSSERGPRMFRHVREADRRAHVCDYPALSYPHMFILQGGYKAFCRAFPQSCTPAGAYLPMDHPHYTQQLKLAHKAVKAAWARTKRSFEQAQQKRGRRFVLRPPSGAPTGGMLGAPGVVAAQHDMNS